MKSPSDVVLSISVVTYYSDMDELQRMVASVLSAIRTARENGLLAGAHLDLIQNSPSDPAMHALVAALDPQQEGVSVMLLEGHGNIGYGRAHNLSIRKASSHFHLILNPDVVLAPDSLSNGLRFMAQHPDVVAISPMVTDGNGERQYVCKRYPSVLDFSLRGFAPGFLKKRFAARLSRYEMQDLSDTEASMDIPIISGCFMFFRTAPLKALGGFDETYFLYFEDFDLSLRAHTLGSLAYLPSMRIVHSGGHSARKGLRHIGMFARSGCRFYHTHGWRLL